MEHCWYGLTRCFITFSGQLHTTFDIVLIRVFESGTGLWSLISLDIATLWGRNKSDQHLCERSGESLDCRETGHGSHRIVQYPIRLHGLMLFKFTIYCLLLDALRRLSGRWRELYKAVKYLQNRMYSLPFDLFINFLKLQLVIQLSSSLCGLLTYACDPIHLYQTIKGNIIVYGQ